MSLLYSTLWPLHSVHSAPSTRHFPTCVWERVLRCPSCHCCHCCIKHFKLSVKIKRCIAKLTNVASKRAPPASQPAGGIGAILVALVYKAVNRMCICHHKQRIKVHNINSKVDCFCPSYFSIFPWKLYAPDLFSVRNGYHLG